MGDVNAIGNKTSSVLVAGFIIRRGSFMSLFRKFAASDAGNITILFAFMLVLLLLFAGGAVDFSRRNAVRTDLIESLDAAGLAIAQLDEANPPELAALAAGAREAYLKDYGKRFFLENFKYESLVKDLSIDFEINPQLIRPTASGSIKTLFLGAASVLQNGGTNTFASISMSAGTEITRRGSGPIELALVLDVTGSMNQTISGVKKMKSLRDASDALLDVLFGTETNATSDFVKVGVVPFSAFVNPGKARDDTGAIVWKSAWSDVNAEAAYHGSRFLHVTSASVIDLNTKVNHFTLFDSNVGTTWKGCFEARPYPLDELDIAPGASPAGVAISGHAAAPVGVTNALVLNAFSTAPALSLSVPTLTDSKNTRFVPLFAPDGPNCNSSSSSNRACEYGSTTSTRVGITYSGSWFGEPDVDFSGASYPGTVESSGKEDFGNSYIDDRRFTRVAGTPLDNYLPVVNYMRRVLRFHVGGTTSQCPTSPSSTVSDPALYAWLNERGATECFDDEYVLRDAYVGTWNTSTLNYENKYNQSPLIDESISESSGDTSLSGPNASCQSPILTQSNQKKKIRDHIQALAPAGNTNSAEGMMWGWRLLSPEAPFESDIPYNDSEWQKAVVLMTDGFNTVGSQNNYRGSSISAYGFAREQRMGANIDTAGEMLTEMNRKLLRICTRMKQKGILVYAITFGLSDSDPDELATKNTFRACANDSSAPYYFDAPKGSDLESAFKDIAADLVKLHVSR